MQVFVYEKLIINNFWANFEKTENSKVGHEEKNNRKGVCKPTLAIETHQKDQDQAGHII